MLSVLAASGTFGSMCLTAIRALWVCSRRFSRQVADLHSTKARV